MQKAKPVQKTSPLTIGVALSIGLVLLNVLFLMLARNAADTVSLLNLEFAGLEQNEKILTSSQEIYETYQDEIEVISSVFPNENTIPIFVQSIEEKLRAQTDEYSFKFNSVTPVSEQTRLYLPISIVMRTNLDRLQAFLSELEALPYLTHINTVSTKTPEGFTASSEITITMKVYVQNPFTITE